MVTRFFIEELTPTSIVTFAGNRCRINSLSFNLLNDEHLVLIYRAQQVLNVIFNDVFRSIFVSCHHAATLIGVVTIVSFSIRFNYVLNEQGEIAYFVVICFVFSVMAMLWCQSELCGEVVNGSQNFKSKVLRMMPRKFYFRKFATSCPVFYMQLAYPFYNIRRHVILQFCEQVINYTVTVLLW